MGRDDRTSGQMGATAVTEAGPGIGGAPGVGLTLAPEKTHEPSRSNVPSLLLGRHEGLERF